MDAVAADRTPAPEGPAAVDTGGETAIFDRIEDAIADVREGRMVVVVDDESRENEGDLVMAAERATPDAVNFMARFGRGLICVALTGERLDQLRLPQMVEAPEDSMKTAFTVSVDARGTTTGISAFERAMTIRTLIDPATRPEDLLRPGHIFPLRAKEGGVLRRPGHTEAAVDLARLAGLYPAGVLCEIMNDDGTMARLPDLVGFCRRHGLRLVSIADLVAYRRRREKLVRRVAEAQLPTDRGRWRLVGYEDVLTGQTHVALTQGDVDDGRPVLVRMHSECLTGDVFGSQRCDCGEQLRRAMSQIAREGRGVVVYLRQEGRGIGLANKVRAYSLQDAGLDTVEANLALGLPPDMRDYGTGAQILADLGVRRLRLLTNNPKKYAALAGFGLEIVERVPIEVEPNPSNAAYLKAKKTKLGHLLDGNF
jgi:3,4-dihydroxy 2-butanone 4-phosphate synthase/GTP cyclohydrolase II